ncbi:hypothetical protein HMPREF9418_1982 [Neisseria macacae ATCC 33926]|uniref:Uncharacterized protein n=1 Tax=Neisseria macacae ATCC 33926 TaxID=997348 RepID=A0AA36UI05_9NEIS|nr:hypothetical protein HMPREF9418_1982 [Neisseria macacae ATCC 33926]
MNFKTTRFERHYKLKGRLKTQYSFQTTFLTFLRNPISPKANLTAASEHI